MLHQIRAILEAVEMTGMPARLRHPCAPRAGVLELDAAALRVLEAHYSMPQRPEYPDDRAPIEFYPNVDDRAGGE